jgi:hypothetical protein
MGGLQISQKEFELALLCWWASDKWCHCQTVLHFIQLYATLYINNQKTGTISYILDTILRIKKSTIMKMMLN